MSLESCIRKAGKALTKEDAVAIRAIRDDLLKTMENKEAANVKAVDEYLDILQSEKDFIMQQVEAAGGVVADPSLSPSAFSQRAAENLEEAARRFPRKGIYRPETETEAIDYKTGQRIPENMAGRGLDPNLTRDLLTERTNKTVEMLYPDWYGMTAEQVIRIVNTFDPPAALGLAKKFGVIAKGSRSIETAQFKQVAPEGNLAEMYDWGAKIVADWITKNETLPLRYKVEDPFERGVVDAQPENPLSVSVKYAAAVQAAEDTAAGPVRKLVNKLVDTKDMTHEAVLAAVPQTKLPDFMRYGMDDVRAYTRTVKKMDAWMNKVIEGHHALAKQWLNFNKDFTDGAKMLGEFMHASTLAGVDVPSFQFPDRATFTKMNQQKREMWLKRQKDYKALQPFWEKLGKMGAESTYQQFAYDPKKDTMMPVGPASTVSEGQRIYLAVRDTYMNQRTMLMWNLEKRIRDTEADEAAKAALIAKLRQQFESGLITPYFPLTRFGKYQAVAKTKRGEVVAFIKRESRRERNTWMQEMRDQGYVVVPFEQQATDLEQMNKIDPNFVASVTDLLEDTEVTDIDGRTIPGSTLGDQIWQMYLRTLPELSARKAYIHRIGRLGFTHDALRAFSDHTFHGTHQTAKLRYAHEMSELLRDIEGNAEILMQRADQIKNWEAGARPEGFEDTSLHEVMFARIPDYADLYSQLKTKAGEAGPAVHEPSRQKAFDTILKEAETDGPWAVPLANEMSRRHQYNMNPTSAAWSTKLTALGFLWFLSTSPAAGVLNLTQTAISAYPILRARFQGKGAGVELLRASKEYATAPTVDKIISKLRGDEAAAMEEFAQIGMFSKTRTRELLGLSEGGSGYSMRQEQFLEFTGYIFHKTEEMNRAVTALAAYRLARKEGRSHSQAVLEAEELVEVSHYDYTNTNRPRFMQGDKGRVVFLFRNYSVNMIYRLIRDFRDGIWKNDNISVADRKEAKSRFLGIIGMTTIFAGVTGWPLFWAAESIANNLLDLIDEEEEPHDVRTMARRQIFLATSEYMGEMWGQKIATAIMKGPWSAFTGADLSQRASLNNLFIRDIPQNLHGDPQGLMYHLMGEALGPVVGGMPLNFATGFRDLQNERPDRAIERFVPKAVADVMKTIRFATQGAQNYQRDMILSPDEFTNQDLFLQASGFTPTRLADRYEQNRAIKNMENRLRERRQDLMNRLFMAWRVGDRAIARDAMQDIAEWNRNNPRYPISPEGIQQSARSRAAYDARTVGGIAVEQRLQYLQEQMRFTARPQQ